MTSALELEEYFNAPPQDNTIEEEKSCATQIASAASRGQKASRGTRGTARGAKNGRGRGANTSSAGAPRPPVISGDVMDGNLPNYRQTTDAQLMRSSLGYPLCNYCGKASHKRQHCALKLTDRQNGLTRVNHPDKDKNTAEEQKGKNTYLTSSAAVVNPYPFGYPMHQQQIATWPPWQGYQPSPIHNSPNQNGPLQQRVAQVDSTGQLDIPRNYNTNRQENVSATMANTCPYPTCHVMLTDQNQALEHMFTLS